MLPTVPFPSYSDKEDLLIARREKRTRRNALTDAATNSFRRPLLQRAISPAVPQALPRIGITILTNPASTRTLSVPPIHKEKTHPSTICRSSPSAAPPHKTYTILSNPARTPSLPPIQDAPLSSRPVSQSRSPPRITILTNPAREKHRMTQPRPSQNTLSNRKVSATAPAPTVVPIATSLTILRAPIPAPRTLAPTRARAPAADIKLSKPTADAFKEELKVQNIEVKVPFPMIVVHKSISCEARPETSVHHPETGTGMRTTSHGQMLGVPIVDSRSRLPRNDLARYYPEEHAEEQMLRSRRLAAARRKECARRRMQTATTTTTATPTSSVALMVSRINARTSAPTRFGKYPIIRAQTHKTVPLL